MNWRVTDSYVAVRKDDVEAPFHNSEWLRIHRYAIVPLEEYEDHRHKVREFTACLQSRGHKAGEGE